VQQHERGLRVAVDQRAQRRGMATPGVIVVPGVDSRVDVHAHASNPGARDHPVHEEVVQRGERLEAQGLGVDLPRVRPGREAFPGHPVEGGLRGGPVRRAKVQPARVGAAQLDRADAGLLVPRKQPVEALLQARERARVGAEFG